MLSNMNPSTLHQMIKMIQNGLGKTHFPKKIIIVGAGMAGLVAASLLKEAGHQVIILEASDRVGGRVYTLRSPFTEGRYLDAGAMRIPHFHYLTLAYIQKFGLPINLFINSTPRDPLYVNGIKTRRMEYERNPDILRFPVAPEERGKTASVLVDYATNPVVRLINQYPQHYWEIVKAFDMYSMDLYLSCNPYHRSLSVGAIDMIKVLLAVEGFPELAFLEILRELLIFQPQTRFYEITGGNDQLPKSFLPQLKENILFRHRLRKIIQQPDRVIIQSTHTSTSQSVEITGNVAIITIPFTLLNLVEVDPYDAFSYHKWKAIHQLHYVGASKIGIQFENRFWEEQGIYGGQAVTDLPIRFAYYPSHGFGDRGGVVLASYTWEDDTAPWNALSDQDRVQQALENLAVIHGNQIRGEFVTGTSYSWAQSPFAAGAFAMFKPGQETELSPYLSVPEGSIYFAGEHTSHYRGWIQGAVESGIRVAQQVNNLPQTLLAE
ncbi:flavin monoamine oxidase family protein [Brevibacillus humidisoli]|uniref:flavin monoamine oxidase family protein n=1 Tax=Brevibacillus humidisoli TaxID=2895522 RepID=UPI001E391D13|nr:flavin monoamine oxidase family protein [Brevibacillus humidisoli]UFJ39627.1 flavin monoamine oxidase family protein [Brevibacillus humidisoli]